VLDANAPKAYAYLLSNLIKQAESEVSAKAEAGFPLARVVLGLILQGHAALSDILFARLSMDYPLLYKFTKVVGGSLCSHMETPWIAGVTMDGLLG